MMATRTVRIYTCKKHPNWTMESSAPLLKASLKTFCPHCRDEFFASHIGEADCRIEQ